MLEERYESVVVLRLNRPESLNAWTAEMSRSLVSKLARAAEDPKVRVCVLTGVGSRAFSAGADLRDSSSHAPDPDAYLEDVSLSGDALFEALLQFPKPLVCAINGYAIGIAFLAALCCDVCVASSNAAVSLPQITFGIMPGYAGVHRLAQWVGRGRALEIAFTGRFVDAAEAQRIGLFSAVYAADQLDASVRELAERLAQLPPVAAKIMKESIYSSMELGALRTGAMGDVYRFLALTSTQESREGHERWRKRDEKPRG